MPRYSRMLGNAPAAVEAWQLLDQKIRISCLHTDWEYVEIEELVIVIRASAIPSRRP